MKKTVLFIMILSLVFSCSGCLRIINKSMLSRPQGISAEAFYSDDSENTEENSFTERFYLKKAYEVDYLECIATYVQSGSASEELVATYELADSVEAIPVLGSYLESTNLATYLFYESNQLTGSATLAVKENGGDSVQAASYSVTDVNLSPFVEALSDQQCYNALVDCKKQFPNFEILGVVYNTVGYPTVYPIGICEGETTIKYVAGEPTAFKLVDPFSTLEEGKLAFENYFKRKQEIRSELIIYPWATESLHELGYIRKYEHQDVYLEGRNLEEIAYLFDYDNMITVPLLNQKLGEDQYVLHLLYHHNDLIAELVLEKQYQSDGKIVFASVWQNVAAKNENGDYSPITQSKYEQVLKAAQAANADMEIRGVIFDDSEFVPFGFENRALICYDADKDAFD